MTDKGKADDADCLKDSRLNDCKPEFRVAFELRGRLWRSYQHRRDDDDHPKQGEARGP